MVVVVVVVMVVVVIVIVVVVVGVCHKVKWMFSYRLLVRTEGSARLYRYLGTNISHASSRQLRSSNMSEVST